jgi:MYXO-CTERM domain-containing protein
VIFHVSVSNPLDTAMAMVLEVSGPNAAWATLPSVKVDVPAHDTARASVVVRAPVGSVPGERADLVLQAYSRDDPATRGLLRFVTVVDTDTDYPDDTAAAAELTQKDSPSPGTALLVGLIGLLAVALRRRR